MGLKGYRLWVMGQLDSTCRAPPMGSPMRGSLTWVSSYPEWFRYVPHGEGRRTHKHEHRLDEDEISPTSLVHTYRADQWASCKATHNSTRNPRVDRAQTRTPIGPRRNKATSLVHTRNPRVDTTNTNTDSTKTKSRPRHWFTRTGLTDGRHAKLHTALRWCRSTGSGSARRQGRPARRRPRTPCSGTT
jgi:hypothetical protein